MERSLAGTNHGGGIQVDPTEPDQHGIPSGFFPVGGIQEAALGKRIYAQIAGTGRGGILEGDVPDRKGPDRIRQAPDGIESQLPGNRQGGIGHLSQRVGEADERFIGKDVSHDGVAAAAIQGAFVRSRQAHLRFRPVRRRYPRGRILQAKPQETGADVTGMIPQ